MNIAIVFLVYGNHPYFTSCPWFGNSFFTLLPLLYVYKKDGTQIGKIWEEMRRQCQIQQSRETIVIITCKMGKRTKRMKTSGERKRMFLRTSRRGQEKESERKKGQKQADNDRESVYEHVRRLEDKYAIRRSLKPRLMDDQIETEDRFKEMLGYLKSKIFQIYGSGVGEDWKQ